MGLTVGIRNRSQADIKAGKSIACCLEEEKKYFKSHPVYGQMSQHFFGVPALTDKLTRVLFLHIKHFLPEIKKEIQVKSRAVSDRIHELGEVSIERVVVRSFCPYATAWWSVT